MSTIIGSGAVSSDGASVNQALGVGGSIFRFVPLTTFTADVDGLESVYVKGMRYTVTPDNQILHELAENWISLGKVKRVR